MKNGSSTHKSIWPDLSIPSDFNNDETLKLAFSRWLVITYNLEIFLEKVQSMKIEHSTLTFFQVRCDSFEEVFICTKSTRTSTKSTLTGLVWFRTHGSAFIIFGNNKKKCCVLQTARLFYFKNNFPNFLSDPLENSNRGTRAIVFFKELKLC